MTRKWRFVMRERHGSYSGHADLCREGGRKAEEVAAFLSAETRKVCNGPVARKGPNAAKDECYAATMWFFTAYFTNSAVVLAPSTSIMRYL
jgi:hypothetical protein